MLDFLQAQAGFKFDIFDMIASESKSVFLENKSYFE